MLGRFLELDDPPTPDQLASWSAIRSGGAARFVSQVTLFQLGVMLPLCLAVKGALTLWLSRPWSWETPIAFSLAGIVGGVFAGRQRWQVNEERFRRTSQAEAE